MSKLIVRVYNVIQGDAILIKVPDKNSSGHETMRHILIDVGNLWTNKNDVFKTILSDVAEQLDGRPLDLYVMTHEHMDHVEGLKSAFKKWKIKIKSQYSWLTASAAKDYYTSGKHPDAERLKKIAEDTYREIDHYLKATKDDLPQSREMAANNKKDMTDKCVNYLRTLAPASKTFYVHRETDLRDKHPFKEAKLEILAPEENTATYYLGLKNTALGVAEGKTPRSNPVLETLLPPMGVDAGSFYRLVKARREGYVDGLLSIDKANNNTSIVFTLKWRGWKLLFTGDAEEKSWEIMQDKKLLKRVDFLKVSHHGSHNGTPFEKPQLKKLLLKTNNSKKTCAVISVGENTWEHPEKCVLDKLGPLTDLTRTDSLELGSYIDFEFPG